MQIKINEKFKVISHDLGSSFLVLNTSYFVQIFPGLLIFKDMNSDKKFKIYFKFKGPAKKFTILQNLFNGNIEVNFHSKSGYISYKIGIKEKNAHIFFDRVPNDFKMEFNTIKNINSKEIIQLPITQISEKKPEEYIFFGVHKKPDLYFIRKRQDLQEILPFVFLYSQFYLDVNYCCCLKKNCILKDIEKRILTNNKNDLFEAILDAYKVHFSGAFIPRMNDEEYQNIIDIDDKNLPPFCVFHRFYNSIKSMLVCLKPQSLQLLPCLPKEFHHGRAKNIKTKYGMFDIEWSKKLIKKVIFCPIEDSTLKFIFQSDIKTFRVRSTKKEKGKIYKNIDPINFEKNKIYWIDKIQK